MLMSFFSSPDNHDSYREALKRRRVLFLLAVLMGAAAIAVSIIAVLNASDSNEFAMGFITGSGFAVAGIGLFGLWSIHRTLKDEKRLRADFIKETDERTQEIARRASRLTTIVTVFVMYGALLASVLLNRVVFNTLLAAFAVYCAITLGCTLYYKRTL